MQKLKTLLKLLSRADQKLTPIQRAIHLFTLLLNRAIQFSSIYGLSLEIARLSRDLQLAVLITKQELLTACNDEELELTPQFIEEAFKRDDRCYGIKNGEKLVSYAWVTKKKTHFSNDLWVKFSSDCSYIYKCYTKACYRGRRYNHETVRAALLSQENTRLGIISIEINNFSSIRSFQNLGSRIFGWTCSFKLLGKRFLLRSRNCKPYDFSFVLNDAKTP